MKFNLKTIMLPLMLLVVTSTCTASNQDKQQTSYKKYVAAAVLGAGAAAVGYDMYKHGFNSSYTKAGFNNVVEYGRKAAPQVAEGAKSLYAKTKLGLAYVWSKLPSWNK